MPLSDYYIAHTTLYKYYLCKTLVYQYHLPIITKVSMSETRH